MGLRCLLGHDFDEPELRREREEDGEEVVITVSEEKTCSRCGYAKTVSENKEVTSIEQLAQTAGDGESATEAAAPTEDTSTTDAADTAVSDTGAAAATDNTGATMTGDAQATAAADDAKPTPEPTVSSR